jgi:hypothetical protein
LLAMMFVMVKILQPKPKAQVTPLTVHIHVSPPGATIRIDNETRGVSDLDIGLPVGNHQIEAQLDGYQTASSSFQARPGAASSIDLTLQPILPVVKLTADTGAGRVSLDDKPAIDLDGAQWTSDSLSPGSHRLRFSGSQADAEFTFTAEAGSLPAISGPLTAKGMHAVVVSNWGNRLHVYYSDSHARLSLDSQSDAEVGAGGVDFPNVSPGPHQLSLRQGSDRHTVPIDVGTAPTLTAFLISDQDIGTLLVVTGEDNVQVYLNNQLQKRTTQGGQLRIPNLAPKDYVVRVAKNGFQNVPEQQVAVRKGDVSRLNFALPAIPHLATLTIEGGAAGAAVFLSGEQIGTIQPDGKFQLATVNPGDHVIELRKPGLTSKILRKHFVAGSIVSLSGAEAAMEVATAQVKITFTPGDAVVTVAKDGQAPIKITSGTPAVLAPGTYDLKASVGNFTRSVPLEVAAGESRTIGPLSLSPGGIQDFDDPSGWKPNQSWFVHRGGGFVLYKTSPTSGTFVFSAMLDKGHRLQWVFNYTDDNNYALFQMDENYFYRSEVRGGKTTEEAKIPFKTDKKKSRTFQIVVTPNRIVHQIQQGNAWTLLDSWTGASLNSGKFGFYLPGNDEVELSNFTHYSELKLR